MDLPTITSGRAITVGPDGSIYAGGDSDLIYRYTPGADEADELGPVTPSTTSVFDLTTAPDGSIWGGGYPRGEIWQIVPATGTIDSLGQVRAGADYARSLTVGNTYAYVAVGSTRPEIIRVVRDSPEQRSRIPLPVPLTSGIISDIRLLGRFLAVRLPSGTTTTGAHRPAERRLYDLKARTWDVPANVTGQSPSPIDSQGEFHYVADGKLWGVDATTGVKRSLAPAGAAAGRDRHVLWGTLQGRSTEWMLTYDPQVGEVVAFDLTTYEYHAYPAHFRPLPLTIKSLTKGGEGQVFVGGYGGPSLAIVNLRSGATTHLPRRPVPKGGATIGEIEGSIASGHYQYLGTYTQGKIFRYDRRRPWVDGSNPTLLANLGTSDAQDRPRAWAASDSHVFFGTIPRYGQLGGGLGIIDPAATSLRFVRNVVPDQSVVSLAAVGDIVYGGTSRWGGLGAAPTTTEAKVFAYDASTGTKLWEVAPVPGAQAYGSITIGPGGTLWASRGGTVIELDPRTGATLRQVIVADTSSARDRPTYNVSGLVRHEDSLYLQTGQQIYEVDPDSLRTRTLVADGVTLPQFVVVDDSIVYAAGVELKKVALDVEPTSGGMG
ncbi:PQQ-binding-like beta-propeller repeat protein [Janibacter sp. DB-40]|uniref:outer membrane protein assembly factor BamB family protein n=1 Tax=Janibacter sp. DB-40 TaxID=3028808 RepID=UPI002404B6FF|nr:PQQ-binding-like beta-propeller repeat protein [Janibacter sp. DB-40]